MRIRTGGDDQAVRHPAWISRVKARARDSRGFAIVEAAFVTPIFFVLILGIFEVGMAMNDYLALASSVRAGSRAASASGNDTKADLYTVLGLSRESSAIDPDNIVRIVIYRSDDFGEPPPGECQDGTSVDGVCNVYTAADFHRAEVQVTEETEALEQGRAVDPAKITFGCNADSPDKYWCPTDRNVTLENSSIANYAGPDYVGVWMRIDHPAVTGAGTQTFTDFSVIRLEPRSK